MHRCGESGKADGLVRVHRTPATAATPHKVSASVCSALLSVYGTKPGLTAVVAVLYVRRMDRRSFLESCTAGAACISAAAATPAFAADARPRPYARVVLVDERGDRLKAASLKPQTNYVFQYPFEATPVFLLDLGKPALPASAQHARPRQLFVARRRRAESQHRRVLRDLRAQAGLPDARGELHQLSQDTGPARRAGRPDPLLFGAQPVRPGARRAGPVGAGAAAAVRGAAGLTTRKDDSLTAYATLGGELFDDFFRKYEAKLSLEMGPKARNTVVGTSTGAAPGEVLPQSDPVLRERERTPCAKGRQLREGRERTANKGVDMHGPATRRVVLARSAHRESRLAPVGNARYSLASRCNAAFSVSSFFAKQKRTTRWSKPSP